jgi:hypothetical protein
LQKGCEDSVARSACGASPGADATSGREGEGVTRHTDRMPFRRTPVTTGSLQWRLSVRTAKALCVSLDTTIILTNTFVPPSQYILRLLLRPSRPFSLLSHPLLTHPSPPTGDSDWTLLSFLVTTFYLTPRPAPLAPRPSPLAPRPSPLVPRPHTECASCYGPQAMPQPRARDPALSP